MNSYKTKQEQVIEAVLLDSRCGQTQEKVTSYVNGYFSMMGPAALRMPVDALVETILMDQTVH